MKLSDIVVKIEFLGGPDDGEVIRLRFDDVRDVILYDGAVYRYREEPVKIFVDLATMLDDEEGEEWRGCEPQWVSTDWRSYYEHLGVPFPMPPPA